MPETILLHLQLRKDPAGRFLGKWGLGNRHKKPFFFFFFPKLTPSAGGLFMEPGCRSAWKGASSILALRK